MSSRSDDGGAGSSGQEGTLLDVGRGGLVTARGTSSGLVLRLDARAGSDSLHKALSEFIEPRRSFLTGNSVSLEWVGGSPEASTESLIAKVLHTDFKISVGGAESENAKQHAQSDSSKKLESTPNNTIDLESAVAQRRARSYGSSSDISHTNISSPSNKDQGMLAGLSELSQIRETGYDYSLSAAAAIDVTDPANWDNPDARVVYTTLRSGQLIETEHSLIIFGDVNPGAEVRAGGDIVVLGSLRGIAHAGAFEETGGGRMIFALDLRPTQLRIGSTISRGSEDPTTVAEVARVDGNIIVVEPYRARSGWIKRLS